MVLERRHMSSRINNRFNKKLPIKITNGVPVVTPDFDFEKIFNYLNRNIKKFETINYIYVVDKNKKLLGVFSIKELYRLPKNTKADDIYKKTPLVTINEKSNKNESVYLALKHNVKAIPVIDDEGIFLGVYPSDAILSMAYREMRADLLQIAGISRSHPAFDNVLEMPVLSSIKHRLPWLFVGLLGGVFAAQIIGFFEETLARNLILAAFIPLVVYIADAVGTQLEAFTIRDMALFRKLSILKYFLKQFLIIFLISIVLGSIIAGIAVVFYHDFQIAIVLGVALMAACVTSVFTGIIVPVIFRKLRFDPANASGPIGTIIQDVLSVFIYFVVAAFILGGQ